MTSLERITRIASYGFEPRSTKYVRAERSYQPIDPDEMLTSWFADSNIRGVLFGIQHAIVDIHRYIADKLIPLADLYDVHDVYFEESVTWQDDFEAFRQTGIFSAQWAVNLDFINRVNGTYEDHRPFYETIRSHPNMRLHFIDTPEDRQTCSRLLLNVTRDRYMMNAFKRRGPKGKFLIICGAGHAAKDSYPEFNIKRKVDEEFMPFGKMITTKFGRTVRAVTAVGNSDYKYFPLFSYFNEVLPSGHAPIGLDIAQEVHVPDSVLSRYIYRKRPLELFYDYLFFFPHAIGDA